MNDFSILHYCVVCHLYDLDKNIRNSSRTASRYKNISKLLPSCFWYQINFQIRHIFNWYWLNFIDVVFIFIFNKLDFSIRFSLWVILLSLIFFSFADYLLSSTLSQPAAKTLRLSLSLSLSLSLRDFLPVFDSLFWLLSSLLYIFFVLYFQWFGFVFGVSVLFQMFSFMFSAFLKIFFVSVIPADSFCCPFSLWISSFFIFIFYLLFIDFTSSFIQLLFFFTFSLLSYCLIKISFWFVFYLCS